MGSELPNCQGARSPFLRVFTEGCSPRPFSRGEVTRAESLSHAFWLTLPEHGDKGAEKGARWRPSGWKIQSLCCRVAAPQVWPRHAEQDRV